MVGGGVIQQILRRKLHSQSLVSFFYSLVLSFFFFLFDLGKRYYSLGSVLRDNPHEFIFLSFGYLVGFCL